MIEKIRITEQGLYNEHGTFLGTMPKDTDSLTLANKINELVDAVNELQNRIDPPSVYQVMKDKDAIIGKHIGEKQRLQDELERTRKALDVAKDKLDTVRQYHRGTAVIRPDDIAAYCDRAIKQITALTKGGNNE